MSNTSDKIEWFIFWYSRRDHKINGMSQQPLSYDCAQAAAMQANKEYPYLIHEVKNINDIDIGDLYN